MSNEFESWKAGLDGRGWRRRRSPGELPGTRAFLRSSPGHASFAAMTIALCVISAGCQKTPDDLPSEYGERSELRMASSVNGYGVLADMFTKAGYTVSKRSDLTPSLREAADAIVYAP